MKFRALTEAVLLEVGLFDRIKQGAMDIAAKVTGAVAGKASGVPDPAGTAQGMTSSMKVALANFTKCTKEWQAIATDMAKIGARIPQTASAHGITWDRSKQQMVAIIDLKPIESILAGADAAAKADGFKKLVEGILDKFTNVAQQAQQAALWKAATNRLKTLIATMKTYGYTGAAAGGKFVEIDPATLEMKLIFNFGGSGQLHDDIMAVGKLGGGKMVADLDNDPDARAKLSVDELAKKISEGQVSLGKLSIAELQAIAVLPIVGVSPTLSEPELVKAIGLKLHGKDIMAKKTPQQLLAMLKSGEATVDQIKDLDANVIYAIVQAAGLTPVSNKAPELLDQIKNDVVSLEDPTARAAMTPDEMAKKIASGQLDLAKLTLAELQAIAVLPIVKVSPKLRPPDLIKAIGLKLHGKDMWSKKTPQELLDLLKNGRVNVIQIKDVDPKILYAIVQAAGLTPVSNTAPQLLAQIKKDIVGSVTTDIVDKFASDPAWRRATYKTGAKLFRAMAATKNPASFSTMLAALNGDEIKAAFGAATIPLRSAAYRATHGMAVLLSPFIAEKRLLPADASPEEMAAFIAGKKGGASAVRNPGDRADLEKQTQEVVDEIEAGKKKPAAKKGRPMSASEYSVLMQKAWEPIRSSHPSFKADFAKYVMDKYKVTDARLAFTNADELFDDLVAFCASAGIPAPAPFPPAP